MRTIERIGQFKRDYKREKKGQHRQTLEESLLPILGKLADDEPLEPRHRDHALTGDWHDHRDFHVKPDLVLTYRNPDDETLQLVRLGSRRVGMVKNDRFRENPIENGLREDEVRLRPSA
jgi:mRNA interferase YafQ